MKSYLPMMQERVTLYQKKSMPDEAGGAVERWDVLSVVWASIRLETNRTFTQSQSAGQRAGSYEAKDALFEVVLRHEIPIVAGMRLLWNNRLLVVVSDPVQQINRQFQLIFASLLKPSEGGGDVRIWTY